MAKAGLDHAIPLKADDRAVAQAALHYLLRTEAVDRDGCGREGAAAALPWLAGSRSESRYLSLIARLARTIGGTVLAVNACQVTNHGVN
jgi:hypothetical protein